MRIIDLINLRDGLIIDAMIEKIPEDRRENMEKALYEAFERASGYLYNEQAPIILTSQQAQLLRASLDKDIFDIP
jgi:hypothetical protein